MTQLNMLEAKTNLTKMIRQLETKQEDEFIICRNGQPCAKLVFYEKPKKRRILGKYNGKYTLPSWEEWKQMDEEIADEFEKAIENF